MKALSTFIVSVLLLANHGLTHSDHTDDMTTGIGFEGLFMESSAMVQLAYYHSIVAGPDYVELRLKISELITDLAELQQETIGFLWSLDRYYRSLSSKVTTFIDFIKEDGLLDQALISLQSAEKDAIKIIKSTSDISDRFQKVAIKAKDLYTEVVHGCVKEQDELHLQENIFEVHKEYYENRINKTMDDLILYEFTDDEADFFDSIKRPFNMERGLDDKPEEDLGNKQREAMEDLKKYRESDVQSIMTELERDVESSKAAVNALEYVTKSMDTLLKNFMHVRQGFEQQRQSIDDTVTKFQHLKELGSTKDLELMKRILESKVFNLMSDTFSSSVTENIEGIRQYRLRLINETEDIRKILTYVQTRKEAIDGIDELTHRLKLEHNTTSSSKVAVDDDKKDKENGS